MEKIVLLIVDPQNDFCHPEGALYVPGAEQDARRLGRLITRLRERIAKIHVTLDTHHYMDIAHPVFWLDKDGQHPPPFTIITEGDIEKGIWRPANPSLGEYVSTYARRLRENDRYDLCVWPPHTIIGSWGHNVVKPVYEALVQWEESVGIVDFVTKGVNFLTEHYSAIQADVPDPADPSTMPNRRLIEKLRQADVMAVAGEALSHCVANTVRDFIRQCEDEEVARLVLVEDATSPVKGFEEVARDFVDEMRGRGMRTVKAEDFLKEA